MLLIKDNLLNSLDQPYYKILLRLLVADGHIVVADEINNLLRKEEKEYKSGKMKGRAASERLSGLPELLNRIADTLKLEQTLLMEGNHPLF